jgi:EAL domain-containing protein (putative c-di-GMP-specific phosphodiesterase class I)
VTESGIDQTVLLADDDPAIGEGLALLLERTGRRTILCYDIESAEISLTRYPITHFVCDVQFTGDFGFEGLHFLGRVHKIAPDCRIVLMTGQATESLRNTAARLGAAQVLAKPFGGADLERALQSGDEREDGAPYEVIHFPKLDDVIVGDELTMAFQPIVAVQARSIALYGYEALARVRGTWTIGGPGMLFEYAERVSRLPVLNIAAIRRALQQGARAVPAHASLFVNVDPITFTVADLPAVLDAASAASGFPLSRVVLEITERSGFVDEDAARQTFAELRKRGIRFALDDHGSAYSHLAMIEAIQPSFIKVSHAFGSAFEQSPTKERIVRHVVSLARDFGCDAILEGVETEATALAVASAGIPLAQGYYFGRPASAEDLVTFSARRGYSLSNGLERASSGRGGAEGSVEIRSAL